MHRISIQRSSISLSLNHPIFCSSTFNRLRFAESFFFLTIRQTGRYLRQQNMKIAQRSPHSQTRQTFVSSRLLARPVKLYGRIVCRTVRTCDMGAAQGTAALTGGGSTRGGVYRAGTSGATDGQARCRRRVWCRVGGAEQLHEWRYVLSSPIPV